MSKHQDAKDEIQWRDWRLQHDGLLDHDQPTETAHIEYRRHLFSEFTSYERMCIRSALGL